MTSATRRPTVAPQRLRTPLTALVVIAFTVMALAQIAVPLSGDDTTLSTVVVTGFALTSGLLAGRSWGALPAAAAAAVVLPAMLVVEHIGASTGLPFGDYRYSGLLRPTIGEVPAVVPLAWFAMGVPALEVGTRIARSRTGRVLWSSAALTAWDLFLDPQMTEEGYWVWESDGTYRGIPLSNYLGWFLVAAVLMAVLDRIRPAGARSAGLLWLYGWWTVISVIGFVAFFGDPFVGLVGGAGMGTCLVVAVRSRSRRADAGP